MMTNNTNLLQACDWTFPVPIAYGPGRLKELASLCAQAGMRNPLIVTDRGSRDLPFIADAQTYLQAGGMGAGLYASISPNPRDDEIAAGKTAYRNGGHDGIVAIGGGSGMDGGKAVCLVANNDLDLFAFNYDVSVPEIGAEQRFPPLICVPTSAGTGAEKESTAIMIDM